MKKNFSKKKKPFFKQQNRHDAYSYPIKKKVYGQHFLRKQSTVDGMISKVGITSDTTVLEIGCGDGFLTKSVLNQTPCKQLICYEIDQDWASFVQDNVKDTRLDIRLKSILDVTFEGFEEHLPCVILANLPYQITFPIMFLIQKHKHLFNEGVVMVQEEVAQKIVARRGKPYSATSIFLQHHFDFELMEKVEPGAFAPPPKVFSRLVYFKPKKEIVPIREEEGFWKFLKLCFRFPRQTLKNNLKSTHFELSAFTEDQLAKRAQQLSFDDFLVVWHHLVDSKNTD